MATRRELMAIERGFRQLILEQSDLPEPDRVEYGRDCVRFFWDEPKLCVQVDADDATAAA